MNLDEYIAENTDMTLQEAREYLHTLEMEAWRKLGKDRS